MVAVCLASASVFGLSGCSARNESHSSSPTPSPSVSSTPAVLISPSSGQPETPPAFSLPAGRKVLVSPRSGTSSTRLRFRRQLPRYTIYLVCAGGGSLSTQINGDPANTWPCDRVPTRVQVAVDDGEQTLTLTVHGTAEWQLGVIDGVQAESDTSSATVTAAPA
jgi:hypothetical protein